MMCRIRHQALRLRPSNFEMAQSPFGAARADLSQLNALSPSFECDFEGPRYLPAIGLGALDPIDASLTHIHEQRYLRLSGPKACYNEACYHRHSHPDGA